MDRNFNYSNSFDFDQYQPPQSSVTQQLPQRSNEDIQLEMAKLIKNNRILLNNNIFTHEETSMSVLLAKERILKLIQAWDEKQIKSWSLPELLLQLSNDSRTIDEMLKQHKQYQPEEIQELMCKLLEDVLYLENSSKAITSVLPTEEPEYSLSMRNEHLDTIPETELDELIKSSVENLVPIPRDIHFLEELFSNDPIPLPENKSFNFDHYDEPSFPRPPPKPSDVEVFFDFQPDSGELISAVMNNIDELIEDERFDPGERFLLYFSSLRVKTPFLTPASPLRAGGISSGWNFHVL
nr:hypothetical protein [Tanacetum cinerariifolium]GFA84494.1 hypothetical protein [Tanacetum cinerariifolium]